MVYFTAVVDFPAAHVVQEVGQGSAVEVEYVPIGQSVAVDVPEGK